MIDPEPVDVVVPETRCGNFAYEEHLLRDDARRAALPALGRHASYPQHVRQFLAPVISDPRPPRASHWSGARSATARPGAGRAHEPQQPLRRSFTPSDLSALPAQCCDDVDLRRANRSRREARAEWRCERAGDRAWLCAVVGMRARARHHAVDEPARAAHALGTALPSVARGRSARGVRRRAPAQAAQPTRTCRPAWPRAGACATRTAGGRASRRSTSARVISAEARATPHRRAARSVAASPLACAPSPPSARAARARARGCDRGARS